MFPWGNSDNPLESLFKKPSFSLFDQNPISKQHDDSPFFSNFPSPFFDEHELPLHQILPQFNLKPANQYCAPPDQTTDTTKPSIMINSGGASKLKEKAPDLPTSKGLVARKRTGKKDRHSKICTAQGIRDRRMRLSLQVARKFFDLQDMLGYDKASKTIEWLFNQSNKAIKELTQGNINDNNISISDAKSESFISECEVVSGSEENSNSESKQGIMPDKGFEKRSRKTASKPNMRESREMARERARCRTREKMMNKRLENSSQWCKSSPNDQSDLQKLGSSNMPFDHQGVDASYSAIIHQSSDVGTIEKFLGSSSSSTISCPNISDYTHHCIDPNSNFMGFLGNWDLINNDRLNSSQFAVTNQVSLAGNPSSVYSATTSDFPLFHQ